MKKNLDFPETFNRLGVETFNRLGGESKISTLLVPGLFPSPNVFLSGSRVSVVLSDGVSFTVSNSSLVKLKVPTRGICVKV